MKPWRSHDLSPLLPKPASLHLRAVASSLFLAQRWNRCVVSGESLEPGRLKQLRLTPTIISFFPLYSIV